MLKSHNPYNVLSEIISFENVQQMGEMIALKTLRGRYAYARQTLEWLYVGFVKDLNRSNDSHHVFSDAYDLAQTAICFLCEFVGKSLNDVYMIKNGQEITIKKATYLLVSGAGSAAGTRSAWWRKCVSWWKPAIRTSPCWARM